MDVRIRILIFGISLVWLVVVVRLVQKRSIWERHALLWVYMGLLLLVLPVAITPLDLLLTTLGVAHPPSFLFFMGFVAVFSILLQCTVEITRLVRQNRDAIQNLAILEERVRELEDQIESPAVAAASRRPVDHDLHDERRTAVDRVDETNSR